MSQVVFPFYTIMDLDEPLKKTVDFLKEKKYRKSTKKNTHSHAEVIANVRKNLFGIEGDVSAGNELEGNDDARYSFSEYSFFSTESSLLALLAEHKGMRKMKTLLENMKHVNATSIEDIAGMISKNQPTTLGFPRSYSQFFNTKASMYGESVFIFNCGNKGVRAVCVNSDNGIKLVYVGNYHS